jgi:nicotinamide riboside kinase
MKRVVLTGPESTGKSTLTQALCAKNGFSWVSEYARLYLNQIDRPYVQNDLLEIAKGQIATEKEVHRISDNLVCDTDLLTIKVWSEFKYGNCNPWIVKQLHDNLPDLYLICYPDLEWKFDPLRENPNDRKELFEIYLAEIKQLGVPYNIIKGVGEQRLTNAMKVVNEIIF